ncbi:glycosyltransferase family 2 protein [Methanobrevibacter sp.]|uniref:glycosyltransferase family 2 protein n=1 Tax=Methanobrevibacter sp. TaxID=66852 RepID=UPI003864F471
MPKISVILPIYNTAEYLPECIGSVLNQTFGEFELICVNDGSTDNSLAILEDYRLKDNRLRIITQENKGLSSARNTGLNKAKGDYILFLDSDDYLTLNALEELYSIASDKSLDLILFKIINFDDETREKSTYSYFELTVLKGMVGSEVFNYEDIKGKFFRIPVTAPGKLYKKELLEDMEFRQGLIFEDNPFFIELMFKLKKAMVFDEYLYHRRVRNDSITNSNFSKFKDCVEIYNIIEQIIRKYGRYEELKGQLFHRRCRDIYLRFSQVPDEFKKEFFNLIKRDFTSKRQGLKEDGTLDIASKRSKFIFDKAIECDDYKDFEVSVNEFDLSRKSLKKSKGSKIQNLKKLFKH